VSDASASRGSAEIRVAAERLLEMLFLADCELSIALVDDPAIRALNRDWLGIDRATDVLSFSQREGRRRPRRGESLGDVVISVETARRQAGRGGWTLEEEVNRLLVHGLLHLLGYEHERGGVEEARMKAEEARLSAALVAAGFPCACENA
jgi:probable rRNA maturation factor